MMALCFIAALQILPLQAASKAKSLLSRSLSDFILMYPTASDPEDGKKVAEGFARILEKKFGVTLEVVSDSLRHSKPSIMVGPTDRGLSQKFYESRHTAYDYAVHNDGRNIALCGGGVWALEKSFRLLLAALDSPSGAGREFSPSGSIRGEYLFPRADSCNLRILNQNVWRYDGDTIPKWWRVRRKDCRNAVRAAGYADVVSAWRPDVITLQEYSPRMKALLEPVLAEQGYVKAYYDSLRHNFTPIYYRADKFEVVRVSVDVLEPSEFNTGMNTLTTAVLRFKKNQRLVVVMNTQLWSHYDKEKKGSNFAKVAQVKQLVALADSLKRDFDVPFVLTGDMSATLSMLPMKQLMTAAYVPAVWKAASKDFRNGYHDCSLEGGYSRKQPRPDVARGMNAVDHIFIGNIKEADRTLKVQAFGRIMPEFVFPLSPHAPCYTDLWVR